MHHVDAPERVTRAVGVYEWTGDLAKPTAARFVPVSLFIDSHFEDAGLYLPRPIPFAIEPGDIYDLEHAGEPAGVLDLNFARRVVTGKALADDNPVGAWYAYGKFTPETEPKTPALHPSAHLSTIQSSAGPSTPAGAKLPEPEADDRPHMTRRTGSDSPRPGDASSKSGSDTTGGGAQTPSGDKGSAQSGTGSGSTSTDTSDDTDRPTLRKRDPSQDASRRGVAGGKSKTASVTAAGPALGDDPDRPTLTRGSTEAASTPELTGLPADLQQAVAVSDASHEDHHDFARSWETPAERASTLAAMEALARPRLLAYLHANQLVASDAPIPAAPSNAAGSAKPSTAPGSENSSAAPPLLHRGIPQEYKTPKPAAPEAPASTPSSPEPAPRPHGQPSHTAKTAPAHRHAANARITAKPSAPAAPLTLSQEGLAGYTLTYGGLPTFVYTAVSATAPAHPSDLPTPASNPIAYITVVAQRLPSGELQAALTAVTDSTHLDRSPRLRLIDAVDPDDSHRASLLFELRGASSRQFALYRLTTAQAEQTFTTASIE